MEKELYRGERPGVEATPPPGVTATALLEAKATMPQVLLGVTATPVPKAKATTAQALPAHQQKFRFHHMRYPCILTQATSDLHPESPEHPDARYAPWLHPVPGYHPP